VKLLVDENLSEELVGLLEGHFEYVEHVRVIGLAGAPDSQIWAAARNRGASLVTKDEDFCRLSVSRGAPPKVIWVRMGNVPSAAIARRLLDKLVELEAFATDESLSFLELR
jgi:predicted nuclease of predicted toxin-antitoxin system